MTPFAMLQRSGDYRLTRGFHPASSIASLLAAAQLRPILAPLKQTGLISPLASRIARDKFQFVSSSSTFIFYFFFFFFFFFFFSQQYFCCGIFCRRADNICPATKYATTTSNLLAASRLRPICTASKQTIFFPSQQNFQSVCCLSAPIHNYVPH